LRFPLTSSSANLRRCALRLMGLHSPSQLIKNILQPRGT
jgi:hypothetical protein